MRSVLPLGAAAVLALAASAPPAGQVAPALRWLPAAPLEGSLVSVIVAPGEAGTLAGDWGTVGEEPLHFERTAAGELRAVGAVALGGADSVPLEVGVRDEAGVVHHLAGRIPVARRTVRRERIRAAPEFTRPPDSALAERIATEREQVREVLRRTHETPRLWEARFVRPRASRVTSPFGAGRLVNGAEEGRHRGVDFAGARGSPVRASNRGVVGLTGEFYYGGRSIYLDHGAGLVTGYLHLSAILVAEGDTVVPGQLVGRVGASGRVTGPHLHWLAHYGRTAVDPLGLLGLEPVGRE